MAPFAPMSRYQDMVYHGKLLKITTGSRWFVPKAWFSHFYIYGLLVSLMLSENRGTLGSFLLILHLFRRLCEQLFLFPNEKESKMHAAAYVLGYVFYTGVSWSMPPEPCSIGVWLLGNLLQFCAHAQLFQNRVGGHGKEKPPNTLIFRYMYCPHYFGEMLIYAGLSSFDKVESLACLVFVVVSLCVNWRNHSLWYQSRMYSKQEDR